MTGRSNPVMLNPHKVCRIKHAINVSNASASIDIGGEIMSVDVILIRMSQLSKRRNMLDKMRKQLPKARVNDTYGIRKGAAEYPDGFL